MQKFDFIVIGGGIAGLAAAGNLARFGKTALLEMESQPCYHSSGRSAAIYSGCYGAPVVRKLSRISNELMKKSDIACFGKRRGILFVQMIGEEEFKSDEGQIEISIDDALKKVPILNRKKLVRAFFEEDASDLDVHEMSLGFIKKLKSNGAVILNFKVEKVTKIGDNFVLESGEIALQAPKVINAAGAWADEIAQIFGAKQKGIIPKRRSAALIDPPPNAMIDNWPMVLNASESVYFKPDAGKLMVSPADATPCAPHDCWPEDIDIATGIYHYSELTNHEVSHVTHQWAGLRNFVADNVPLIGEDGGVCGFFWLAALGGYGVQSAFACGEIIAALVTKTKLPNGIDEETLKALDPAREILSI